MRFRAFSLTVSFLAVLVFATGASAAIWERPVDAPIIDGWRPPEHKYAAGNRGVDFAPGSVPVKAAAEGSVSFIGKVGGVIYVVITHASGLRTTYGHVEPVEVEVGQQVLAGQRLGTSSGSVHFGVRSGDDYLNPNMFYGRPALIPL